MAVSDESCPPMFPLTGDPCITSPIINQLGLCLGFMYFSFSKTSFFFFNYSMLDYDTENLNSEEIYSSLRGVTEAIEKFSFRSQEDLNEPIKRDGKKDCDIVSTGQGRAWLAAARGSPLTSLETVCSVLVLN